MRRSRQQFFELRNWKLGGRILFFGKGSWFSENFVFDPSAIKSPRKPDRESARQRVYM